MAPLQETFPGSRVSCHRELDILTVVRSARNHRDLEEFFHESYGEISKALDLQTVSRALKILFNSEHLAV